MAYEYARFRDWTLTDEGQRKALDVLHLARRLCAASGVVRGSKIMVAGDTWQAQAIIDRLVEVGELRCVNVTDALPMQDRVYEMARP